MVEKGNNYNYPRAIKNIADFMERLGVAGCELMMLPYYYDEIADIKNELRAASVPAITTHCEKEVGTLFSDAGAARATGDSDNARALLREGLRLFRLNCEAAAEFSSSRLVLHLWGGKNSDSAVDYNISLIPELENIAREYSVSILIENIPCTTHSPLKNLKKIAADYPECRFVFDTRFGMFHRETRETLTDAEVSARIDHVHISDFKGGATGEFKRLRPILHPLEGDVDFPLVASELDRLKYAKTINLESPVMRDDASLDLKKLEDSLSYLADIFHINN